MIRIDENYSEYRDGSDPGYPGGKAVPVSAGNRTDGTPWRALFFNDITGFFQALIVEAFGEFIVSGIPDEVGNSDLLAAVKKLGEKAVNPEIDSRVTANANRSLQNRFDIDVIKQILPDLVREAPEDGQIYGRRNRQWAAVTGGGGGEAGDFHELMKAFSKKTMTITNARIVDRRKRGWDIGLPYLSPASRAYHFDTDQNDQNQTSNIEIGYCGEAPALADKDRTNGQIYFNPAVLETVPHEMKGRSLYGHFSLKSKPQTSTETATAEMWIRLFDSKSAVVLEFGSGMEKITFQTGTKGATEAAYGTAEEDGILDGAGETPVACGVPETDGIRYGAEEADGTAYGKAEDPLAYSVSGTDIGNAVIHEALDGTREVLSLDGMGIAAARKTWLHVAAVSTPGKLSFFIGDRRADFVKKSAAGPLAAGINPAMLEFNLDELMLDETAAAGFDVFAANTGARIPWAGLDYTEKHFVLEAQDPALAHTSIFESEQFREAVYAAIDARP
jgi:hypothetical protein